jgi:hypothetical protein
VLGYLLDGQELAEFVDVSGHAFGDALGGIEELEVFESSALALLAADAAIAAEYRDASAGEVEVAEGSAAPTVDGLGLLAATATDGLKALVGLGLDDGQIGLLADGLTEQPNSTKGKIRGYSACGHPRPPVYQKSSRNLCLDQDSGGVHYSFVA